MTDAGQAYDFRACTPEMIRDHLVSCFEESYSGLLPAKALAELVRSLRSDSLGGMLPNEDERSIVIGDAERIVGSAVWAVRGNMAYIWGFYVRRHAQRAGIGTSLLKRICSEVPAGTILEVTVLKQSESAIAFYRHLGFDLLSHAHGGFVWLNCRPGLHSISGLRTACPQPRCAFPGVP